MAGYERNSVLCCGVSRTRMPVAGSTLRVIHSRELDLNSDATPSSSRWIGRVKLLVRITVLVLVSWGIWRTVAGAQQEFQDQQFALDQLSPGWLLLAGLFYLAGQFPSWVFWHRTLLAMGQRPRMRESFRAYWIGHLGKYVPGKAMVVVLRAGLVHGPNVDMTVAATSVFVETLTLMAVGAFMAAAILIWISPNWLLTLLALGLMTAAGLPTWPPLFRRIVRMLRVHHASPKLAEAIEGLDLRLMATGWASISLGWAFLGLSLWASLRAIPILPDANVAVSITDLPLLLASTALAIVAGFLSLIPGGLGVRDWILMTLLVPKYGAGVAVISAVLLRLVWLLSELTISAILYLDVLRARRISRATPSNRE
jgi:uncharacterized membrane protein YbhN (UPF0104 family)